MPAGAVAALLRCLSDPHAAIAALACVARLASSGAEDDRSFDSVMALTTAQHEGCGFCSRRTLRRRWLPRLVCRTQTRS
jgi:hypothetical protein